MLFSVFMLSLSKSSFVGEGENQDERANFEGCFPQQVSGLYQRAQMVRRTNCSLAHAAVDGTQERVMHVPSSISFLTPGPAGSVSFPIEGLSHSKEELGLRGAGWESFLVRMLELVF